MVSSLGGPGAGAGVTHLFAYLILCGITVSIFEIRTLAQWLKLSTKQLRNASR